MSFPKTTIGQVFEHASRMWRRGKGRYYVAHPCKDSMIQKGYLKRLAKRERAARKSR